MGLFGSLGKLGAKNAAKSIEDSRQERIQAYSQSNMVQFAQSHSEDPELRAGLLRFDGLADTYFDVPGEPKRQKLMFEMVSLLVTKPERIQALSDGLTYFVIVHPIGTSVSNGMIACENGIFDGRGALSKYIAREDIAGFEKDKKGWIHIVKKGGEEVYLTSTDSKAIKADADRFLELFRLLYC